MDKLFYKFVLQDKTGSVYLNKEQINGFSQTGVGMGSVIKMTNGDTYKVAHTEEQILSILGESQDKS